MDESFDSASRRIASLRGPAAVRSLQALARRLAGLSEDALAQVLVGASSDLYLAAAMAASDDVDRVEEAGELAEAASQQGGLGASRHALVDHVFALRAFHHARFEDSIEHCAQGLRRLGDAPVPLLHAQLWAQRAVASKHLGRRDEALAENLEALRHATGVTAEAIEIRATLHNNIGVLLLAQGDADGAIRHLELALEAAEAGQGTEGYRVMVHLNVGRLLLREGHDAKASVHLERAASLAQTADSLTMRLRAQESLAHVRRRQGRFEEALTLLNGVIEHWEGAGSPLALCQPLLGRGRVQSDLGNPMAESDLLGAYELAAASDGFDLMREATEALTDFFEQQQRYREACIWHQRRHELEERQYDQERSARLEEMHARHRVERAEQQLIDARDRAEAANRAKTSFLSVTSHELRTPLNAIVGFAELLLDDARDGVVPPAESLASDVESIHTAARRLQRLIDRVLTLTDLDRGEGSVERRAVSLPTFLEELLDELRPRVVAGGNRLNIELGPELSETPIHTDPAHLSPIVRHLVDNAAGFTENGEVTVEAHKQGNRLVLHVRDTGVGFEPGTLDQLLQPFHQTDMSFTRSHEGLGIGLTLCRHHCDVLGGVLSAETTPGEGSSFRVELPWD